MSLVLLVALPLAGGVVAWLAGRRAPAAARWIALASLAAGLPLTAWVFAGGGPGRWAAEVRADWIPRLGVSFHLGIDGLSAIMVGLSFFLGVLAVAASWRGVRERVGFFHFNLLWVLAGVIGVFLALDLFLFFFFWELMLIPMVLLIAVWGSENRTFAAIKFFIFTQAGGLAMLVALVALGILHHRATGVLTFAYGDLLASPVTGPAATWIALGFLAAFLVKLPAVPFHTWLPDAHTQAPTAGSVVLAGLMLKTGAYGILRFVLPLFPGAARDLAPAMMTLGVAGIVYGAVLAFGQIDLKRLVAYTSVSHLGFVLLGAFAGNEQALQGAIIGMVAHGLSTGALFIVVGSLYERLHTRDLARMGGLWNQAPRMGVATTFFALASLGLPGLGNFVGELLVLLGAWRVHRPLAAVGTAGLVLATVYSLWIVQRAFHGPPAAEPRMPDLDRREAIVLLALAAALVWLGVYPQPLLDLSAPTVAELAAAIAGHP